MWKKSYQAFCGSGGSYMDWLSCIVGNIGARLWKAVHWSSTVKKWTIKIDTAEPEMSTFTFHAFFVLTTLPKMQHWVTSLEATYNIPCYLLEVVSFWWCAHLEWRSKESLLTKNTLFISCHSFTIKVFYHGQQENRKCRVFSSSYSASIFWLCAAKSTNGKLLKRQSASSPLSPKVSVLFPLQLNPL